MSFDTAIACKQAFERLKEGAGGAEHASSQTA
jgi:hypothetical protein